MWGKQTVEWFSRFKGRETSAEDCQFSRSSLTGCQYENVNKVHKICKSLTMYPLRDGWQVRLSYGKLQRIQRGDLNMQPISAKSDPRLLIDKEKQLSVTKGDSLLWHSPLWLLLVSQNEIAAMTASFTVCP